MADQTVGTDQQNWPGKGQGLQYLGSAPPLGTVKRPRTSLLEWLGSWFAIIALTIITIVTGFVLVVSITHNSVSKAVKYGQVELPGSKTLQLPAGRVDLILESDEDEGFSLGVPASLTATVTPVAAGVSAPSVVRDVGGDYSGSPGKTERVNGEANSYRRVWIVQVAQAGEYRVVTGPAGFANPNEWTVDAGIAPSLGAVQVWERVLIPYGALLVLWIGTHIFVRLRERRDFNAKAGGPTKPLQ
jgi:hypothetical protein